VRDAATRRWLAFGIPLAVFETYRAADVLPLLHEVEAAAASRGLYAVGALAYEAAPGLDPALTVSRLAPATPLAWFGLFDAPRVVPPPVSAPAVTDAVWSATLSPKAYRTAFDHIKRHIREGDAYQVDLTYRLRAALREPPFVHFARLVAAQRPAYAAFLPTPDWTVCSASPELFFDLDGDRLESRPMKGTAPRGLTLAEDREHAAALSASEKNRAENVMIVDMARNDIGRVSFAGSVDVPELFAIEKYPTVWQMTSTVRGRTHASVSEIFSALFPAASITGAPKSSAMRLIAELESGPRGFYTGAVGFLAPERRAQFNVAIRTLVTDADRRAEYGTGGGVVWDSDCALEQDECRTKARILEEASDPFSLLETMLWKPADGVFLLEFHLVRLAESAEYFGVALDLHAVRGKLEDLAAGLPRQPHRLRLLVAQNGAVSVEAVPFDPPAADAVVRVALAPAPVDGRDPFLYHKTTRRRFYERALEARPGFDDVLLFNKNGDVTESTRSNVVIQIDGARYTPPVRCGLLPGTFRRRLVESGEVTERSFSVDALRSAEALFLVNSLRGMQRVEFTWR